MKERIGVIGLGYVGLPVALAFARKFPGTVGFEVDRNNVHDLTPVERASETVGRVMGRGSIVVYESTVYPGVTEDVCGPLLERVKVRRDQYTHELLLVRDQRSLSHEYVHH